MSAAALRAPPQPRYRRQAELARRIVRGAALAEAAKAAGLSGTEGRRLSSGSELDVALATFRILLAMPTLEALGILGRLCTGVLFRLVVECQDAAVAAWLLWTLERGLDPAMELAKGVLRALHRRVDGASVAHSARQAERPEPTFEQEVEARMARVAARLRRAVCEEIVAQGQIAAALVETGAVVPQQPAAESAEPAAVRRALLRAARPIRPKVAELSPDRRILLDELSPDEQGVVLGSLESGP